jgi:hypothetical protein
LSQEEIDDKFDQIVGEVADDRRREALAEAATTVFQAPSVDRLAALLAARPKRVKRND